MSRVIDETELVDMRDRIKKLEDFTLALGEMINKNAEMILENARHVNQLAELVRRG